MNRTLFASPLLFALFVSAAAVCAQSKPAGTPVPEDSTVFAAFQAFEQQPAYRMSITMQTNDPRMAQAATQSFGMGSMETVVKSGVHQATTHMTIPALDQPGTVDDWEIRALVKDGRGARIINSPAIPRLQKKAG